MHPFRFIALFVRSPRRLLAALVPACAAALLLAWARGLEGAAPLKPASAAQPKHDPVDQPFRRAPMAESSRSIVVPLATNLFAAYDGNLFRPHTVWLGRPLNLFGAAFTGEKQPSLATVSGRALWRFPPLYPWYPGAGPVGGRPAKIDGTRFEAVSTGGDGASILCEIGDFKGHSFKVRETPGGCVTGTNAVFVRSIEMGACTEDMRLLVQAGPKEAAVELTNAAAVWPGRGRLSFVTTNGSPLAWVLSREGSAEAAPLGRAGWAATNQTRLYLSIPKHEGTLRFQIVCDTDLGRVAPVDLALARPIAKTSPPLTYTRDDSFAKPATSDGFYQVEHFPLPKEADLLVGGMDWLPNGDLAVCTWPGDIYVVENAQGPVGEARYRRFARGLNEPLGLKTVRDKMYVAQKGELTRVSDTDGDGRADLFETVNDQWGYNGYYHSFVFGPVVDARENFYLFTCGQGNSGLPYQGSAMRLSPDGRLLRGFCDGLRAPNGWATLGNDIFVTDNQGNWVGACKLNHLREGKYYGFPSAPPFSKQRKADTNDWTRPALWLPRSLAPSASDIAVLPDSRFGPFAGQMIVGDFQNATVLRVALEKVNGEWQGAVWPFTKGFLSGVNRLSYGPDGKLYVGGCKRGWPSASPEECSLDRVTFLGKTPFEVHSAHVGGEGTFELLFTKPVDPVSAADPENYSVSQFGFKYQADYGSAELDQAGKPGATPLRVEKLEVSEDRTRVTLKLGGAKTGFVTSFQVGGVKSATGETLWHDRFYYTLNAWKN